VVTHSEQHLAGETHGPIGRDKRLHLDAPLPFIGNERLVAGHRSVDISPDKEILIGRGDESFKSIHRITDANVVLPLHCGAKRRPLSLDLLLASPRFAS
jgi:hypothetical protein